MTRNSLYTIIGVLIVLVLAFGGYILWQQSQEPSLEIRLDEQGVSVNGNG